MDDRQMGWTDERIDDLAGRLDQRLMLIHEDMLAMRGDVRSLNERITAILLAQVVALIGAVAALLALVS